MPATYLQTADVFLPNAEFAHQTLEIRPVKPAWAVGSLDPVAVQEEDRVVLWWPDGLCQVYECEGGAVKEFWPKPTIADAIVSPGSARYHRFHGDGSVEQIFAERPYYWGKTAYNEESNGYEIAPMLYFCEETPYGWFMVNGKKVSFRSY